MKKVCLAITAAIVFLTASTCQAAPGDARICTWKDDRTAAFSITIDDNTAPDVEEWLARSKAVNLSLTWFIITGKVGTGTYWGTWDLWRKVFAAGHEVQSHTVTHLGADKATWAGIDWEYSQSQRDIQSQIPGDQVRFLAYPGGKIANLNDKTVAAKYYLASRGTAGRINRPGNIDFQAVNAMSGATLDNPQSAFAYVPNILDPKSQYFGGWAVLLFHRVQDWERAQAFLDFYKHHQEAIWGAPFGQVALYARERDAAKLKTVESTADRIRLQLTDTLDNSQFNTPLTLKVQLPNTWRTIAARQGSQAIACGNFELDGNRFALVQATPGAGEILLENGYE